MDIGDRQSSVRSVHTSLSRSALAAVVGAALLGLSYVLFSLNFLLFHSIAEIFSIVIASSIFVIAWHSRRILDNHYFLVLGVAYLFVGMLDLLHTLAYKGMGVFKEHDANLPTQLWIAARYLQGLSLLIAPLFVARRAPAAAIMAGYALVTGLLLAAIFSWEIFPASYVEGVGQTAFKKTSEYFISLLCLAAMPLLLTKRAAFDQGVLRLLLLSVAATIVAELSFTFYLDVFGISNIIGHLLKITAFYLIYRAIIATGIEKPYDVLFRKLKQSEGLLREERNKLRDYLDIAGVIIVAIGADQRILLINKKGCEILGRREGDMLGKNWFDFFVPERMRDMVRAGFDQLIAGEVRPMEYFENPVVTGSGERLIAWHNAVLRDERGNITATLSSGEDITERKLAEAEREHLILQLQDALASVKVLRGLLPICASCKKIRDDKGYWNQLEVYIHEHSDAVFSHGICPDCARRLYPDIYGDMPEAS